MLAAQAKMLNVDEYSYFFKTNQAPANSTIEWPEYHDSTIIIDMKPLEQVLTLAEITVFGDSLKLFYERIFESQTDYSLKCRTVEVIQQGMVSKNENTLSLQTVVAVNFRPASNDQILTDDELKRILLQLINKYDDHFVGYLQTQRMSFKNVANVNAHPLEMENNSQQESYWALNEWAIVALTIGGIVMIAALLASYRLYKREIAPNSGSLLREWRAPRTHAEKSQYKSLFEEVDISNKDTLIMDDEEGSYESEVKFAFRPSENYADTDSPPESPAPYSRRARHSRLSADESLLFTSIEQEASRVELWAPAGKLGVAIDVVNGQPVVHSLKNGSPLEGFLAKGDRIVQIDEIDTSMMSAADVTSLMVRRMNERRRIVYIRADTLA